MDFKKQQEDIKNYIETHLPDALKELKLEPFSKYDSSHFLIDDFLDLDSYKKNNQLFINFDSYNYDDLTNDSGLEDFTFDLTMAFMGAKRNQLKSKMMDYATAIYKMFYDSGSNFEGIADYGKITTIQFYPFAEGNPDVKIAELTVHLYTEQEE